MSSFRVFIEKNGGPGFRRGMNGDPLLELDVLKFDMNSKVLATFPYGF